MKITITGKQIDLTDGLKARVEEAYAKLDKYFSKETEAIVTLSVQRDEQIVEATIRSGNLIIRVEEATPDMYVSIDTSVDVLERQLRKNKTRMEKRMKKEFTETVIFDRIPALPVDDEATQIVRVKAVETKPMSPEEAVLQLDLIGHEFFIFTNDKTGDKNLVYRRKKGGYGLIEID